jgi:hypothetical protein
MCSAPAKGPYSRTISAAWVAGVRLLSLSVLRFIVWLLAMRLGSARKTTLLKA